MSRIKRLFATEKAYIAYLTAGDGGMEHSLQAALALIDGGVNMLEIGIPFSDPIADGPVIQRASARSLMHATTLTDVLWLIEQIRLRSDIPLILFSYLNPVLAGLKSDFLHKAKCAGVDGLLLVDCPLEESQMISVECTKQHLDLIYVITPATSLARVAEINRHAHGFLYYACRKGTTGVRDALPQDFQQQMSAIKAIVDLPVVVGFGISNHEMASAVLNHADGVVVGSLFVKALESGTSYAEMSRLARSLVTI
jgi:tryptophan synthase alpha chain